MPSLNPLLQFSKYFGMEPRPLLIRKDPLLVDAEERVTTLERELRTAQTTTDRWKSRDERARIRLAERSEELKDVCNQLQRSQEVLGKKDTKIQELHERLRRESDDLREARQITKEDQRTLTALRTRLDDTVALLKARTLELKDAQQLFSKPDTLSDADILRLVGNLNSQIYQTAAQIADSSTVFQISERPRLEAESDVILKRTVGEGMLDLLRTIKHQGDPICVQIALQACLVAVTSWIVETWDFMYRAEDGPFEKIHTSIAEHEDQSVSGRWRALTRSHLSQAYLQEQEVASLKKNLAQLVSNVLFTCGLGSSLQDLYESLVSKFGENISCIVASSMELRRSMGEEMVSCDLETIVAASGGTYSVKVMDDAYSTGEESTAPNSAAVHILCTTELGLRRVEKHGRRVNDEVGSQVTVLLKPKVALESLMEELQLERVEAKHIETSGSCEKFTDYVHTNGTL